MENYLAKQWLGHKSVSRVTNWIVGLYMELAICVVVMFAIPAFLLIKRRRQERNNDESLEHRLRTVDWHMQKEIDQEILRYRKEQARIRRKRRAGELRVSTTTQESKKKRSSASMENPSKEKTDSKEKKSK